MVIIYIGKFIVIFRSIVTIFSWIEFISFTIICRYYRCRYIRFIHTICIFSHRIIYYCIAVIFGCQYLPYTQFICGTAVDSAFLGIQECQSGRAAAVQRIIECQGNFFEFLRFDFLHNVLCYSRCFQI